MKAVPRLAVAACVVGAVALCFRRSACDTPLAERPGHHSLLAPMGELHDAIELERELQAKSSPEGRRRLEGKHQVVTELLADRLTLFEAAARFRDLNASSPEAIDRLRQWFPGVPYELALCRQVIAWVREDLRPRAPAVAARLEAELAEHLRRYGEVRLPEGDAPEALPGGP